MSKVEWNKTLAKCWLNLLKFDLYVICIMILRKDILLQNAGKIKKFMFFQICGFVLTQTI